MKTLLRLLTINFLMSSSYMFSSAGAPARTEQTNKTFTAREIEAMIVDPATSQIILENPNEKRHPLDDFFGQFTRAAADQKELREKVKNDKRFIFNPEHSFERGELVIIPRGDNTYRFALIMGYAGKDNDKDDIYRVQIDKKGAYRKIKTALIGKINRENNNEHASVGRKVATSRPVLADQNVKHAQEKKPALFSEKELDDMMVYYPYPLIAELFFSEYYLNDLLNLSSECALKDYTFSPNNMFNRGEQVMVCENDDRNVSGVVLGYDSDKKMYYVQKNMRIDSLNLYGIGKQVKKLPPALLGKYKKYTQKPLNTKTSKPFTRGELIVLPVGYQAKSVIDQKAIYSFTPDNERQAVIQYFNFDQNNSFKRGELVVVLGSDNSYHYGLVLDYIESSKKYAVQVSKKESFDYPASEIGKLKLNFDLLPIGPEGIAETGKVAFEEQHVPEMLNLITEMTEPYDPAKETPIAKIKNAIHDNDLKKLGEALGAKNEHIEAKDAIGYTPLLFAISVNNPQAIHFLLEKGANPHAKAMIGHGKDAKEFDAFSLAQQLQKDNDTYNTIIAMLENKTLKNDTNKYKADILNKMDHFMRTKGNIGAREYDKEFQELLKQLQKQLTPEKKAELDALVKDIHLINNETDQKYWDALAVLLFKLQEFDQPGIE